MHGTATLAKQGLLMYDGSQGCRNAGWLAACGMAGA